MKNMQLFALVSISMIYSLSYSSELQRYFDRLEDQRKAEEERTEGMTYKEKMDLYKKEAEEMERQRKLKAYEKALEEYRNEYRQFFYESREAVHFKKKELSQDSFEYVGIDAIDKVLQIELDEPTMETIDLQKNKIRVALINAINTKRYGREGIEIEVPKRFSTLKKEFIDTLKLATQDGGGLLLDSKKYKVPTIEAPKK